MSIYGRIVRVSRPKLSGIGRHEGVLLPTGHVAHTTQDKGAHICSWDAFKCDQKVKIENELPPVMHSMALSQLQYLLEREQPYNLLNNNCETFARTVLFEDPRSHQVALWTIAAVAIICYSAAQ